MKKVYDVDLKKLVVMLLPSFMRTEKLIAFIWCLIVGIRTVHFKLLALWYDTDKEMEVTPQVFSLRKLLNDYFDSVNRSIRIEDTALSDRTYIFTEGENQPLYLDDDEQVFIYTDAELAAAKGFVVIVPESLNNTAETARLKAMLNKYKLAGTKYIIRYE
ncbi:hypothetical protein [Sphingobacterium multivorum]|uniref:hypothetical protein n=1 Tax=Sphingobacterium multivorum TaxID=28454 RepID=UPI00289A6580|nr:hypothetical protein [Sphingobacterium multivorum]